jgi:hypothetical protein
LENLAELFADGRRRTDLSDEELKSKLYRQIGRLKMEIEWLKKSPVDRIDGETGMERVSEAVLAFSAHAPQYDDITMMVLGFKESR